MISSRFSKWSWNKRHLQAAVLNAPPPQVESKELAGNEMGTGNLRRDDDGGSSSKKEGKLPQEGACAHPFVIKGLCSWCGESEEDFGGCVRVQPFDSLLKDMRSPPASPKTERTLADGVAGHGHIMSQEKLTLVLDLDHTLLHSTALSSLTHDEKQLVRAAGMLRGDPASRTVFTLQSLRRLTKLRPFVRAFLREASTMYDMYIYTMGDRSYAREIARILDPGNAYFKRGRVFTRSDCREKGQKRLDVIPDVAASTVVILDDTEKVWMDHKANLVLVERYFYFASGCNGGELFRDTNPRRRPFAASKTDESEEGGALSTVLKVLKCVHAMFYGMESPDPGNRDVRSILRMLRREVLRGCRIVCSQKFPMYGIWKKCLELGATCFEEADASATHVVCKDAGTETAQWALENGKFLVRRDWVETCYCLWSRMPEEDFLLVNKQDTL